MIKWNFLKSWKFWVVVAILLTGCFFDLERTKAYGFFTLKICLIIAIILILAPFLTNKERYEKTVTYNKSGKVVGESDWEFKGHASPLENSGNPKNIGSYVALPIVLLILGLLAASITNLSSFLFGFPAQYKDPVMSALAIKAPSESNRVSHPAGFSFIFPAGWEVKVAGNRFEASNNKVDYYNSFFVGLCPGSDSLTSSDQLSDSFQEKPAKRIWYSGQSPKKKKFLFSSLTESFSQEIKFTRGGHSFCIQFKALNFKKRRGPFRNKPVPLIDEYFNTFQLADSLAEKAID